MENVGFSLSDWIRQAEASNYFDGYKLYILRCYDDNEEFIKVGRTYRTIEGRYSDPGSMPYFYEVISTISDNPYRIFKAENKLKKDLKPLKYKPSKSFAGSSECFTMDALNDERLIKYVNTQGINL